MVKVGFIGDVQIGSGEKGFPAVTSTTAQSFEIPSSVEIEGKNYEVKKIGGFAFQNSQFSVIKLPSSIESLGEASFMDSLIKSMDLSQTFITKIPTKCFYGTKLLTNIILPLDLVTIGMYGFYGCSIESIELPEALDCIEENGFMQSSLKSIDLGYTQITKISDSTFAQCKDLAVVFLPYALQEIGKEAFSYCKVTNLNFESSLVSLGAFCFKQCSIQCIDISQTKITGIQPGCFFNSSLQIIFLPRQITDIQSTAFSYSQLEVIHFDCELETVREFAFSHASALRQIDFSKCPIREIGRFAFVGCISLNSIVFPKQLEVLGSGALQETNITSFDTSNIDITEISDFLIANCRSIREFIIGPKIKIICRGAFAISGLKYISIPQTVQMIDEVCFLNSSIEVCDLSECLLEELPISTFFQCYYVVNVSFPPTLKKMADSAFYNCSALEIVDLRNTSLEIIGNTVFLNCTSLRHVYLPGTVKHIGFAAFKSKPVMFYFTDKLFFNSLTNITTNGTSHVLMKPTLKHIVVLKNESSRLPMANRSESVDLGPLVNASIFINGSIYKPAFKTWKNHNKTVTYIDGEKIGAYRSILETQITSIIEFFNSEMIQYEHFYVLDNIPLQVSIGNRILSYYQPSTVYVIDMAKLLDNGLGYLFNLEAVNFSTCIQSTLFPNMFCNCSYLKYIYFSWRTSVIGERCFINCTKLLEIDLQNTKVTRIEAETFCNCTSLETIKLPFNLDFIGEHAFNNCCLLQNIDLGKTRLNALMDGAFQGCECLILVVLPHTLRVIGTDVMHKTPIEKNFESLYKNINEYKIRRVHNSTFVVP